MMVDAEGCLPSVFVVDILFLTNSNKDAKLYETLKCEVE